MKLEKDRLVRCRKCGQSRTVAEWDSDSLAMAQSRRERRDFVSLGRESAWNRGKPRFYYCRTCGDWHRAADLEAEGKE